MLRDDEWNRIKDCLPGKSGAPGRRGSDNRLFVEGIMWMARNGAKWRSLPEKYGKWSTGFCRIYFRNCSAPYFGHN